MKLLFILLVTSLLLSIFAVAKQDKQISKYQKQSASLKKENDSLHRMYDSARAALLESQQFLLPTFDERYFDGIASKVDTTFKLGGFYKKNK